MSSGNSSRRGGRADKGKGPMPRTLDFDDDVMINFSQLHGHTPSQGEHNPEDWSDSDANLDRTFRAAAAYAGEDMPPPDMEEQNNSPPQAQTQSRQLKSDIFTKHFKKVEVVDSLAPPPEDGKKIKKKFRALCNYCPTSYAFVEGGGYGNMRSHLNNKHPDKVGIDPTQTQIRTGGGGGGGQVSTNASSLFLYNDMVARKEVAKFVSVRSLPFNFANDDFYEKFAQLAYNPAAKKISRSTVTRDIKKVCAEYKFKLINEFSSLPHKISLCSDVWSDHWQKNFYMGITSHWVDSSFTLQKRLLAYRDFPLPHSASAICKMIHTICSEYGIVSKIFSISFDNASANTASIAELSSLCKPSIGGLFFHIRCMCHILNLCAQDGLATMHVELGPIRAAITHIHRNKSLHRKWAKFCVENSLHPKVFNTDTPTRWNSTFKILKSTYTYRNALCAFFSSIPSSGIMLYEHQWTTCKSLKKLLKVFDDATNLFSSVYIPTSHLVLENCVKIAFVFKECIQNPVLTACVTEMKEKWLKYFYFIPTIYLCASLLDPNCRESGLEFYLKHYYDALLPHENFGSPSIPAIIKQAKDALFDIFKQYSISTEAPLPTGFSGHISTRGGNPSRSGDDDDVEGFQDFLRLKKSRLGRSGFSSGSNPYREIESYLSTAFEYGTLGENEEGDSNFDILNWWASRKSLYPITHIIAKEILVVPASTVSVEQAFSEGGYILDERRSQITPANLEAQCLMHDWMNAEQRRQTNVLDAEDESETYYDTNSSNESIQS